MKIPTFAGLRLLWSLIAAMALGICPIARAQFEFTTLAGAVLSQGDTNGSLAESRFRHPTGIARDASGNLYIADTAAHLIRKISPAGVVSTLAGSAGTSGFANGNGTNARFNYPWGVAVDASGNVYVADSNNHAIRKVTPAGDVSTFAGTIGVPGSADGTGTAAQFHHPSGLAIDSFGNIYVSDYTNTMIRKITPAGVVTTFAGSAQQYGYADGTGTAARFHYPDGLAFDSGNNLFVVDTGNHLIRKITTTGVVTTFAGVAQQSGSRDTADGNALFNAPVGIAVEASGDLLVTDRGNNTIRRVSAVGFVTTVGGFAGTGAYQNGGGTDARFKSPVGIAVAPSGDLYITDTANNVIRLATLQELAPQNDGVVPLSGQRGIWVMNGTSHVADANLSQVDMDWFMAGAGDFNGDGEQDILVENLVNGQRAIWIMDDTRTTRNVVRLGALDVAWQMAGIGDFNGDNKADIILQHSTTGQRTVWLMNGTTLQSAVDLGSLDPNWSIAAVADFNEDNNVDVLLENTSTGQRTLWLMNRTSVAMGLDLGSLDPAWRIAATADMNSDGSTDIVVENTVSGQRVVWFMNGPYVSSAASLGRIDPAWEIVAGGDFNKDGKADLLWQAFSAPVASGDFNADGSPDVLLENTSTGQRTLWLMSGGVVTGGIDLGTLDPVWKMATVADFDLDGRPDVVLENTSTGQRTLWLMQGTAVREGIALGALDPVWKIKGAADFNGDGRPDLALENSTTGQRTLWLMNGGTVTSAIGLGSLTTNWTIGGAADMNGDGHADIVLEDSSTGQRSVWLMNGTARSSTVDFVVIDPAWKIATVRDFNLDGSADIMIQNTSTGQRRVVTMSGTTVTGTIELGTLDPVWHIAD